MPCHPVISPYQPRNCLETSTALSDDAQLLSSFRVPRIIFDRPADRSAGELERGWFLIEVSFS